MAGDVVIAPQSAASHTEIKVPNVICRKSIQEYGDLVVQAPAGITMNRNTGCLDQHLRIEPAGSPQLRTVTVIPGKVVNMGVVPIRLLANDQVVFQLLEVPFQAVIECPGAMPGDLVQKHDFQVEGFALAPVCLPAQGCPVLQLHIIIKVIVEFCLVVARESILRVEAVQPFC